MNIKFKKLNNSIIKCKKCSRLIKFSKKISTIKRKQNITEVYWGKPVTGFGDIDAKLMIIGLAPAAHGGTRTGRAFTGDKSGDFLFSCLHKVGISNIPTSSHRKDGLKLNSTFITNILKCVPPEDKPLNKELSNCSNYFYNVIQNLKNFQLLKIQMTLNLLNTKTPQYLNINHLLYQKNITRILVKLLLSIITKKYLQLMSTQHISKVLWTTL